MDDITTKKNYQEKVAPYLKQISEITRLTYNLRTDLLKEAAHNEAHKLDITIQLTYLLLKEVAYHLCIAMISRDALGLKATNHLEKARKNCYLIVQYYEEIVGRSIDSPPLEQSDILALIDKRISNLERFTWLRQCGFLIDRVDLFHYDDAKWKWSFVDLYGRFIAVMKNYLDIKDVIKGLDPAFTYYAEYQNILIMLTSRLEEIAERYRNKYELTNKTPDDMKKCLQFVAYHRRLCNLIGDQTKSNFLKKQYHSWSKKLEEDMEKKQS